MRIVIDLQGAQGTSRNRGIGRYSLSLAQSIAKYRGTHEVIIVLNEEFQENIPLIKSELCGIVPSENVVVFSSLAGVSSSAEGSDARRMAAEKVREAFIEKLSPDVILLTSLFEGWGDDCITSIGSLGFNSPTAVVLYDLIPLIHRQYYLTLPRLEEWYDRKIFQLRRSDLILGISDSSRKESVDYLNIPEDHTVNISTAADKKFRKRTYSNVEQAHYRSANGLTRPFLMYVSVPGYRKNHEGLIRAFHDLPLQIRLRHQLLLICGTESSETERLKLLVVDAGLNESEVVVRGYVTDENLIFLYNNCELFVFPSWHEGFGLPALEAMSCGAAVIAADSSSLPEVVGNPQALFSSRDDSAMSSKILEALTDAEFNASLRRHGEAQSLQFSWERTAKKALRALEQLGQLNVEQRLNLPSNTRVFKRPKMAFVSPLPPERSGISDYSADLLPELARHYDIVAISAMEDTTDPWITANIPVRDPDWFREHSREFDRVLYHFGNSTFHEHMFPLIDEIKGVVVLHDYRLTGIIAHMSDKAAERSILVKALYFSHGFPAVHDLINGCDWEYLTSKYSCNRRVVENAVGVIAHSQLSRRMAEDDGGWVPEQKWARVPLLRGSVSHTSRRDARVALGIPENALVLSTFGILGSTKQSRRLMDVWLTSEMSRDSKAVLLFVGASQDNDYCRRLEKRIEELNLSAKVMITGWTTQESFKLYLASTDIAVQLRTASQGETSASALDCLNHGLPTIVNANGTMAEIPSDCVLKIGDEFADGDLSKAIDYLYFAPTVRSTLGSAAKNLIRTTHSPRNCADQYMAVIENFYDNEFGGAEHIVSEIVSDVKFNRDALPWAALLQAVSNNKRKGGERQIFVDVSALVHTDLRTGIQRVVRAILSELLPNRRPGYRIEPIYSVLGDTRYRYARSFTSRFLGGSANLLDEEIVDVSHGDIFLGLDLHPEIVRQNIQTYRWMRNRGAKVYFVVYDLLPILMPETFPDGAPHAHTKWMETVLQSDGAICISKAVADEVEDWALNQGQHLSSDKFRLKWFHLGADVESSAPTTGLPADVGRLDIALRARPTFLMVGTIEPRKGYQQVLAGFELLWRQGLDVNLVIVGAAGWIGLADAQRRTIPATINGIEGSSELNKRLFWFGSASDELLEHLYKGATCLIAASYGEGFGLPLIEAAQHKMPIICRDIPVFREVGGSAVTYFDGLSAQDLARAVQKWLEFSDVNDSVRRISSLKWVTWKESTENLMAAILP